MYASTRQVLDVWMHLEDARSGVHGFGSKTAEIYVYLLVQHTPSIHEKSDFFVKQNEEYFEHAKADFVEIFSLFEKRRGAKITIRWRDEWLSVQEFAKRTDYPDHRIEVTVTSVQ